MHNKSIQVLLSQIKQDLEPYSLAPVIVGISGGADSVALLALLAEAGIPLVAAHCNFHLRGAESQRDEAFVRQLMQERFGSIPLEVTRFDTRAYAVAHELSIEMAARALRYEWFESLRIRYKAQAIAVAHHLDDQAETVLLNLIRGTGGAGLCGMKRRNGYIYRPLLDTPRDLLIEWLHSQALSWVDDSTNSDDAYRRNFIRHQVLPLLQQINPQITNTLQNTAKIMQQEQALIEDAQALTLERYYDVAEQSLDLAGLMQEKHATLLAYRILKVLGLTSAQIADLMAGSMRSGASYPLWGTLGQKMELHRNRLFIITPEKLQQPPGQVLINEEGIKGETLLANLDSIDPQYLVVRNVQRDDYFTPLGMLHGKRRVVDYLKDLGVPSSYRTSVLVLEYQGEIVAIPPLQIAQSVALTEESLPVSITFIAEDGHPLANLLIRLRRYLQ